MTAPVKLAVCPAWCSTPGDHPDNHCVQIDAEILDLYGIPTRVAAFADNAQQAVGVYAGSLVFRPADARAFAAALLNAADDADAALRLYDAEEPTR